MSQYRGMQRGFCSVLGSFGLGVGSTCVAIRFKQESVEQVHSWLLREILPSFPSQGGLGSAHLLHAASTPSMTSEQRLRGTDGTVHSAVIVTGYELASVEQAGRAVLSGLAANGCVDAALATYQVAYSLAHAESDA